MSNVINISRFVDVSTGVVQSPTSIARDFGAVLFVQKGTDGQTTELTKYDDLEAVVTGEGSNTEASKCATVFYGTTYNGIAPTSPFWVATIGATDAEVFGTNFTVLLSAEDYYMVLLDSTFTVDMVKSACSIMQASQTTSAHKMFVGDKSLAAVNSDLTSDTTSISAYCKNNNLTATAVCWYNPNNTNAYYSAAMASFFSTRRFDNSNRKMASLAHKVSQGIQPVDFTDTGITVSATQAFDNLDAKHTNVYANIKAVGIPAWERGNLPSGDDISDYISGDYLNYTITISVWNLLQNTPRVPMNTEGATMIASAMEVGYLKLNAAGVIAGGVSIDGEAFPQNGYKITVPIPTGVNKANGLWEGVVSSGLLAGSGKKVVIANILKK